MFLALGLMVGDERVAHQTRPKHDRPILRYPPSHAFKLCVAEAFACVQAPIIFDTAELVLPTVCYRLKYPSPHQGNPEGLFLSRKTFSLRLAMELRHLRYFVAVADEMSITKAAKVLRLAQPSLTRQIKNLEEELHVSLFRREKKRLELTEDGQFFLARARRLLNQAELDVDDLRSHSKGESSPLKIGYMLDMQYDLLPVTLSAFRRVWPKVTLNLHEMTAAEQIQALHKNKIQIGFVREPGLPPLSGLQHDVITKCKMMAVLPDTYPVKKKTALRLGDLSGKAFISLSEDDYPGTGEWLNRVCREAGFTPNITHESSSTATLIHMVGLEMGVALLPESCVRLPHEGVIFHPLAEVVYSKTHLLWRKENFSLPLQHYIRIVSDCFDGKQDHKVKALPASHPEKKLATEGTLKEVAA